MSSAEPGSSVDSVQDLKPWAAGSNSSNRLISFQGLMIVIATEFIPVSPLNIALRWPRVCGKESD